MVKISVIIPVYKVEPFIERCLQSVFDQTFTDQVECIIVDDHTPDKSMKIAERLVGDYKGLIRFKLLYHEHNRGLASARNTGLNAAEGDYIIHIDSDDYFAPDMLEKMYRKACEENADIVIADYWDVCEDKQIYQPQSVPATNIGCVKMLLMRKLSGSNWNKLVRRSLLDRNKIKYIEGINYGEDMLVSFRLLYYAAKIVHLPQAFLYYVRYNINSYSFSLSRKSLEDIIQGEKMISDFFTNRNLLEDFKRELYGFRLVNQSMILSRSKGKLQKEWNAGYRDISPSVVLKYSSSVSHFYWRVGLFFVSLDMLPVYNLIRYVWRILKRCTGQRIILYGNEIK